MKQIIKRLSIVAAILFALTAITSCRKVGINGDLDGQWRVLSVENLITGEVEEPHNIFYCIYLHTVNLTNPIPCFTANMKYSGKTLSLEFPTVKDCTTLKAWGIHSSEITFLVEHLTSKHLVLVSDVSRITMSKF